MKGKKRRGKTKERKQKLKEKKEYLLISFIHVDRTERGHTTR